MAANLLTARFASRMDADRALARLHELGLSADGARIAEQPADDTGTEDIPAHRDCLLHTRAAAADTERVVDALRASNAMYVHLWQEPDDWPAQDWMSLQERAQTGTGVAPGQGDAEAGTTAPSGADILLAAYGMQSVGGEV